MVVTRWRVPFLRSESSLKSIELQKCGLGHLIFFCPGHIFTNPSRSESLALPPLTPSTFLLFTYTEEVDQNYRIRRNLPRIVCSLQNVFLKIQPTGSCSSRVEVKA